MVNGQSVMAQYYESIRFHINGTRHRLFLHCRHPEWKKDEVRTLIDMEGLGVAFNSLNTSQQFAVSKFIHGWWNTGKQRQWIQPASQSFGMSLMWQGGGEP